MLPAAIETPPKRDMYMHTSKYIYAYYFNKKDTLLIEIRIVAMHIYIHMPIHTRMHVCIP